MRQIQTAKDWAELVRNLQTQLRPSQRFILGIVGEPGVGKSTVANLLHQHIANSIVVPMDGFHLSNDILHARGLRPLKGIPATFDGAGFVALLESIREKSAEPVYCPAFDRTIDASVPDQIVVQPTHQLVIVEGNYLLLDTPPWHKLQALLDASWYLSGDENLIHERLLVRHIAGGRTPTEAEEKIASTDAPNAKMIKATQTRADLIIHMQWQIE